MVNSENDLQKSNENANGTKEKSMRREPPKKQLPRVPPYRVQLVGAPQAFPVEMERTLRRRS